MVFASTSTRRSPRLARAAWLKRLRPRALVLTPVTLIVNERHHLLAPRIRVGAGMTLRPRPVKAPQRFVQQQHQGRKRATAYVVSRLRPRKAGKVIYRPKPQVNLSKPVLRKREVFIMTKNPLFEVAPPPPSATPLPPSITPWLFEVAPRSCTGWSCSCPAPHGYGEGRTNYCRFYDSGPPPPVETTETVAALPMLRAALFPLMLASIGIPVLPSSPCMSQ